MEVTLSARVDTGKGMTEEQLGQVFVPFYTTKERGAGRLAQTGARAMSLFCRPFTKAKVRYFDHGQANEALSWVAAE